MLKPNLKPNFFSCLAALGGGRAKSFTGPHFGTQRPSAVFFSTVAKPPFLAFSYSLASFGDTTTKPENIGSGPDVLAHLDPGEKKPEKEAVSKKNEPEGHGNVSDYENNCSPGDGSLSPTFAGIFPTSRGK